MLSTFDVLSLPVRRDIIDHLRAGPRSVGNLADELGVSQPIMSKQLRILREAGFVTVRVDGQRRWYELQPEPFVEVAEWLAPYRWMWSDRLDRLGEHLDVLRDEDEKEA